MSKVTQELPLAGLLLDHQSRTPLYRQIYEFFREAILEGRLRPGQRLPATRQLAAELGVSRNTILLAFDDLFSEGYLMGKSGSGTYVTATLPDTLLHAPHAVGDNSPQPSRGSMLSERGKIIAGTPPGTIRSPEAIRPFQHGLPAIHDFPYHIWSRIASRQLRWMPPHALSYGEASGYVPLREAIAAYLRTARAVRSEAQQIIIVNGSQQGVDLAARILLDPGDRVWIEDPGYIGTKKALIAAGARLVPVPVDAEGLNITAGRELADRARLVYVTPSHQYPLGVIMSLRRRLELLEWAHQANAWILEDDYNSEYRYAGHPLSSLQGLDIHERVIYMGTFSKVLFPSLRMGYLAVPPELANAFIAAKTVSDRQNPLFEQMVLAQFMEEGHFGRHIRRMRMLYQERQQILVQTIRKELPGVLRVEPAEAGMHLIGWLPEGADDRDIAKRAESMDLTATALSSYTLQHRYPPGLVLGYAAFGEKALREAVRRMKTILRF